MPPLEAAQRLNVALDLATSNIQPPVRFWTDSPSIEQDTGGFDNHSLGYGELIEDRYIMSKVAPGKDDVLFGQVLAVWKAKGYSNLTGPLQENSVRLVRAKSPGGETIAVTTGDLGEIRLEVGLTPVAYVADPNGYGRSGTPAPRDSNGNIPVPDFLDDPYWSH